jgi:antitoxin (DNA-binding transcriptional repressor) of toxin-antitoxin stability system
MDTAIARMRDGEKIGVTLPKAIVVRVIPQAEEQASKPIDDSVFMGPVKNMPDTIKGEDRARIAKEYRQTVSDVVIPAYRRLADFLKNEYLARQPVFLVQPARTDPRKPCAEIRILPARLHKEFRRQRVFIFVEKARVAAPQRIGRIKFQVRVVVILEQRGQFCRRRGLRHSRKQKRER